MVPSGPKVLRFDSGCAAEGFGIALRAMSLYAAFGGIAACRQRKSNNLASLVEMHPYPRLRRYFS
jgi:hypothetical protein